MKTILQPLAIGLIALAGASSGALAQIGNAPAHTIVSSQEIKWSPGPASLPPGAEMAVLHGDPAKEGLFVMRLKFPKGYRIGPHTHPTMEAVTVISGAFRLGMGETADLGKAQALPAGSFFAMPTGMAHYASVDEDAVMQISTNGPWGITYVDPKDDPRQKARVQ